jgi:hypothetical protein
MNMFNDIDFTELIDRAKSVINDDDRKKFQDVISHTLTHIKDNNICLSNPDLYNSTCLPEQINIYSTNPIKIANDICNIIYEEKSETSYLKTIIPYQELELSILNRVLFKFYKYPIIKGIDSQKVFLPISQTIDGITFKLMDPSIELIEIYHKLYMPFPDDWEIYHNLESKLFDIANNKSGGAIGKNIDKDREDISDIRKIRTLIFEILENTNMGILVGHWAFAALDKTDKLPVFEKIQLLIPPDISDKDICKNINNILRLEDHFVNYKTEQIHIPSDYWLYRTTYYITIDNKKHPILDTFNSQNYEIIPFIFEKYKDVNLKIAHPYCICRFLLIDKYIINILGQMNLLNEIIINKKINAILNILAKVRLMKFDRDEYDGIYKDLNTEKKKLVKAQDQQFFPYVPKKYLESHGKLRHI